MGRVRVVQPSCKRTASCALTNEKNKKLIMESGEDGLDYSSYWNEAVNWFWRNWTETRWDLKAFLAFILLCALAYQAYEKFCRTKKPIVEEEECGSVSTLDMDVEESCESDCENELDEEVDSENEEVENSESEATKDDDEEKEESADENSVVENIQEDHIEVNEPKAHEENDDDQEEEEEETDEISSPYHPQSPPHEVSAQVSNSDRRIEQLSVQHESKSNDTTFVTPVQNRTSSRIESASPRAGSEIREIAASSLSQYDDHRNPFPSIVSPAPLPFRFNNDSKPETAKIIMESRKGPSAPTNVIDLTSDESDDE